MTSPAKCAVVTGAGSGIGRATSWAMLAAGYRVALAGRRPAELHLTASGHPNALVLPTDVTDEASVELLFAAAVQHWGRVDVLFKNAGHFGEHGLIDEVPVENWRSVIDVNLTGYLLCARNAFRVMRSQHPAGGRIINNGSVSAHVPRPESTAYAVTKHGVSGLTKSLSLDGRKFGIACGQIDIGNAASGMSASLSTAALQANGEVADEPTFDSIYAAQAVVFMAGLPLEVNVQNMTLMATTMPLIGRG